MSYTYKKVSWQKNIKTGSSIVDEYGDLTRDEAVNIIARKQPHQQVIKVEDGRELLAKSIFYVDPQVEPNAFSIEKMDSLDGEDVIEIYEMCDLHNKVKMIRFITV